jgi:hypothetical protein
MDVAVGRGPLSHAQDDLETVDPGRRFAPAFARVAVVGTRPDGALACRPKRAWIDAASKRSSKQKRASVQTPVADRCFVSSKSVATDALGVAPESAAFVEERQ